MYVRRRCLADVKGTSRYDAARVSSRGWCAESESRKVVRREVGSESSRPLIPGSPFQPGDPAIKGKPEKGSLRTSFAPFGARGAREARARILVLATLPTSHRIASRCITCAYGAIFDHSRASGVAAVSGDGTWLQCAPECCSLRSLPLISPHSTPWSPEPRDDPVKSAHRLRITGGLCVHINGGWRAMVFYPRTACKHAEQKMRHRRRQGAELSAAGSKFHPGHGTTACGVSFLLHAHISAAFSRSRHAFS